MKLIRPNKDTLTLRDLSESEIVSLINLFTSEVWKAEYDFPEYPKWDNWSELIPLTFSGKCISKEKLLEFIKTGVYKTYHENNLIYIGETRSSTRHGMWARRNDFKSTVRGKLNQNGICTNGIQNPYGNGTKFLEIFGVEEMKNVSHRFHVVHSLFCKQAELEQLQMFYDKHKKLPVLHSEIDYNRITKKREESNLNQFFN